MDLVTQATLGASVGEAALGKKVGNKAILWGAIAGIIPDLDVLAAFFTDTVRTLEIHRGFTHSIVFSVLFAPIFGWFISKIYKKQEASWKDWSWLMFLGLVTHPLLDAHTTWGTQLFWPIDTRLAYKNIFVIDPLYTLPLLIFLLLSVRKRRDSSKRRKFNYLGLIISSAYMGLTLVFKLIAYNAFDKSLEVQNISYQEIETRPTPLNSILWSANVKTKGGFLIGYYSLFDQSETIQFRYFEQNKEALGKIVHEGKFQRLVKISNGWYTIEVENGKIYFNDLRFGHYGVGGDDSEFVFSYKLHYENNELVVTEREKTFRNAGEMMEELWKRIKGT